ncbi:MAG: AMP-binding protein [Verrucomicrobiales bacterium]|nr:AMP-binding protein [Verrucomicrobiales bacterium]
MKSSRLQNHWQRLPEAEVRRLQAEKLRHYLRTVVIPFSPRYRDLFREQDLDADSIRTLDDLQRLPFTKKSDLLPAPEHPERFKEFIITPDPAALARRPATILRAVLHGREKVEAELAAEFRPVSLFFTTGRSAEPLAFLLTRRDLDNMTSASRRLMEVCGAGPEFRMLNAFPFAPHLAFWFTHYAGVSFGTLTVSSGGGKVLGTEGNLRLIKKLNPDAIAGVPTFIYHLLQQAIEGKVRCDNLKIIALGGEKTSDGLRRKLRDMAGELGARNVNVLSIYGFTEGKLAWAECPFPHDQESGGYHLYPDLGIIEIVDPKTGRAVPTGQPGEIVFTPLDARGTVVLRYRTGDYTDGGLAYEPCPYCGRTLPRLVGRISRSSEIREMHLDKLKGTLVDFNELEHVLDDAPHIGAWQLELRKAGDDPFNLDELVLHVSKTDSTPDPQLSRELHERFYSQTEVHPNQILFHSNAEMCRLLGVGVVMKEQKVVDHRPRPNGDAPASAVKPELNKTL